MRNERGVITIVVWVVAGAAFLIGVAGGTYLGLYGLLLGVGMTAAIFLGAALATRFIWSTRERTDQATRTTV